MIGTWRATTAWRPSVPIRSLVKDPLTFVASCSELEFTRVGCLWIGPDAGSGVRELEEWPGGELLVPGIANLARIDTERLLCFVDRLRDSPCAS
jgi:hypothetical protein